MKVGIIGYPLTGKRTLFNLMTGAGVHSGIFTDIQKEKRIVKVPDSRLSNLNEIFHPKKLTFAEIEIYLIPHITDDQEKNKNIISELKEMDALIHIVRDFSNPDVFHILNSIEPERDIRNINSEIILTDLILLEKRLNKLEAELKKKHEEEKIKEQELLRKCYSILENEQPLIAGDFTASDYKRLNHYKFLSFKPLIILLNTDENRIKDRTTIERIAHEYTDSRFAFINISVEIENEIAELEPTEQKEFMKELGIDESGLSKVIRSAYSLLNYISFFTVGKDEVKAWTIRKGTTAQLAAGVIHSDIAKGFIRAEVVSYNDFIAHGSMKAVKEKGLSRLEGKEYIVKDGDIINFRFNL